ncbi:MAG: DegV family protein [Acholeplasmatales bacterium]|nr:DegV family protein [Acholeplasmatales bacterium]
MEYLRRGGRVSNAAAFAAKVLNIKPVFHVDNEGYLIPMYKKIGRKVSLK